MQSPLETEPVFIFVGAALAVTAFAAREQVRPLFVSTGICTYAPATRLVPIGY